MDYELISKKWSLQAWQASATARKAAIDKNHQVAEGAAMKMKEVGNDNHSEINKHMIKQGYIPEGFDGDNHMFRPITPDTEKTNSPPANPVLGHKVQIAINHTTGKVSAITHYN